MMFVSTMCLKGRTSKFEKDVMHILNTYKNLKINNIELGSAHDLPDLKQVIKFKKDNGCNFICHGNFPPSGEKMMLNMCSTSQKMQKTVMATAKKSIEFLNKIEGEMYSVHLGYSADILPNHMQMSEKISEERALEIGAHTLGQVCDYAQYYNVKVAVETGPPFPFAVLIKPAEIRELFKKVSKKSLGMLFDLGHIKLSEQKFGIKRKEFTKFQSRAFEFHAHQVVNGVDHNKITNAADVFAGFDKEVLKNAAVTLESNNTTTQQIMESLAAISNFLQ